MTAFTQWRLNSDMKRLVISFSLAAAAAGIVPIEIAGQVVDSIVVADRPACRDCRVILDQIVTLGDDDGPGALVSSPLSVRRDRNGRYFVLQYGLNTAVKVFNSNGTYAGEVGREGKGPGEFTWARAMVLGRGDTLVVFDPSLRRMNLFDSAGQFIGSSTVDGLVEAAAQMSDGTLLVNSRTHSPATIGLPLHIVGEDGVFRRSFGGDGTFRPDAGTILMRSLAPTRSATAWTAQRQAYVLEEWSAEGESLRALVRDAPWFRPYLAPQIGEEGVTPYIRDIAWSEAGKLLVLIGVASNFWKERLPDPISVNDNIVYPIEVGAGHLATRLEVIDAKTGKLELSQHIESELMKFITPDLVVSYSLDGPGYPRLRVWRLSLPPS